LEPLVRTPGTAACPIPSRLLPNRHNGWALHYSRYLLPAWGLDAADGGTRPLDAGPYTFLAAVTMKVREAGRVVNVACLVATGVNATATVRSSAWRSAQLSPKPAGCSSSAA
jgi:hypothetical protein